MFINRHFVNVDTGVGSLEESRQCLQFVLDRLFHPQTICATPGGVCARIKDTVRFLSRNLEREERLMLDSGYSDFAAHKREHEKLLLKLANMERTLVCGDYDNSQVSEFLTDWVNHHVSAFDKPFGDFLRARNGDR